MTENITLQQLREKIPEKLWDQFDQFAAVLATMTSDQIAALIEKMKNGDLASAYREIIAHLSGDEILSAWDSLIDRWQSANDAQVERRQAAANLALGVTEFFLKLALAGVLL